LATIRLWQTASIGDLSWPADYQGPWEPSRNVGQFVWTSINEKETRWKEGIRFLHHVLTVNQKKLISSVAIVVEAGPGKEDHLASGSYLALREREGQTKTPAPAAEDSYLPDFLRDK
jgi:hypothetical protein